MIRFSVVAALMLSICLAVSLVQAAPRGRGGEGGARGGAGGGAGARAGAGGERNLGGGGSRPQPSRASGGTAPGSRGARSGSGTSPGGAWSQRTHSGKESNDDFDAGQGQGDGDHQAAGAETAKKRNSSQPSSGEDAAAGAAAANRNAPQATSQQDAAAGAAAANRNNPQATAAQGAAAGAAAANRNAPQASGAEGAAAGAAAANRNEPAYSGGEGAVAGYSTVRNTFTDTNLYGRDWYGAHPTAWAPAGFVAGAAWQPASWGSISGLCGYAATPATSYNYGVNVNEQDGNVIVDGQAVGTTSEYSQQASDLAASGTDASPPDDDQWLPLGVFAMVRNEQQHPQLIVQLAIDAQGTLRGNYTDELTDHTLPIHGAVDKQTHRAAWTVGDNTQTVMEAGLSDLTGNSVPALIHKNGKTDHWILVRLSQPAPADDDSAPAAAQP